MPSWPKRAPKRSCAASGMGIHSFSSTSAILRMGLLMISSRCSFRRVADGFDVVPVRIEHERAVIMFVILRAQSGRTVVVAAGGEGGDMEGIDLRPRVGREADVQSATQCFAGADPELRAAR